MSPFLNLQRPVQSRRPDPVSPPVSVVLSPVSPEPVLGTYGATSNSWTGTSYRRITPVPVPTLPSYSSVAGSRPASTLVVNDRRDTGGKS